MRDLKPGCNAHHPVTRIAGEVLLLASLCFAAPALAQNNETIEEVVVVGSQIRGASTTASMPVSVVSQEEIVASGATSADELFRTLPGAGAMAFGGSNPHSVNFGINGARGDVASINLRSLGEGNTLVLLNGRRLVDHPGHQTNEQTVPAVTTNMNAIPVLGLRRVEVLRDGASAIYGTDAVAGVVNTVLRKDYEGLEANLRYGNASGTSLDETTLSIIGGVNFNNDQTNITMSLSRFQRDAMFARDRDYSASLDLRPRLVGTAFEGDGQFDNTSTVTPWAVFRMPGQITQNGNPITASNGSFAIIPASLGGCSTTLPSGPTDVCMAPLSRVPDSLRFDANQIRTMIPEVERVNFFATANHTFDNGNEMYTELGIYKAGSEFNRGDGSGGPLSHSPNHIPASNYWNPFGPTTLPDGSPNPNRLPGLDLGQVPAEGLPIPYYGAAGAAFRIMERHRIVDVSDKSYRVVQGLRGDWNDWSYDTAFVYSKAETLDRTYDRVAPSIFMDVLALSTPDAYNAFNGGGAYTNNAIDTTLNPDSVVDPFFVAVDRYGSSSLALLDFKVSNNNIFELPGGQVGVAFGVEHRRQAMVDDRDPRLDGTAQFYNRVIDETFTSDVQGSSPTADTAGSREVFSAFLEFAVPLINPGMDIPLVQSLDLQLAARYEDFSDVGNVTKPRIALSWFTSDWLQIRASYSEGFKAPNLIQTSEGRNSRQVGRADLIFCQARVNRGEIPSLSACDGTGIGNEYLGPVERITFGSEDLRPETNESLSYGFVFQPHFVDGLLITADYWNIKQEGIIGLFGTPNHLALDWALRINGLGSNPLLTRADPTQENIDFFAGSGIDPVGQALITLNPYQNLESRDTAGVDISISYALETNRLGRFDLALNAARLLKTDQDTGSEQAALINAQNNPAVIVVGGGDLMERDQRPEWKASGSINWQRDDWRAGLFFNYVGEVNDTSASNDITQEFFRVDSWTTINAHVGFDFSMGSFEDNTVRLGINNLFDEDPPLADENFGYIAALHNPLGRYMYLNLRTGF
jgi:iron complex outermembrane recepter protein